MTDRFAQKMTEKEVRSDTRLLGDFTAVYCKGVHGSASRAKLESEGVDLGVYGTRVPIVCPECAELLRYAEKRRAYCPHEPKPFCSYCETHCYSAETRDRMKDVMRYAGPRSLLSRHAVAGVKHVIDGRRARAAAARREEGSDHE